MRLARGLERRLEALLDGVAGRVFRGPLHPSELASRVLRAADLETRSTEVGPVAPNAFRLLVNARDISGADTPAKLTDELARAVEDTAWERGWRLDGPATVRIDADPDLAAGSIRCEASFEPGVRDPWATLEGSETLQVRVNRAVLGRGSRADVVLDDERVSRRHALLWREGSVVLVRDLESANGTWADGVSCRAHPVELGDGSTLTLGPLTLRLTLG